MNQFFLFFPSLCKILPLDGFGTKSKEGYSVSSGVVNSIPLLFFLFPGVGVVCLLGFCVFS